MVDTKQIIIQAALRSFAKNGINAVSIRSINSEAKIKNTSAIYYHFGDKLGLLDAILSKMHKRFTALQKNLVTHPSAQANDNLQSQVRYALVVEFSPYIRLYEVENWGKDAIKLFARLHLDADSAIHEIMTKYFRPHTISVFNQIKLILPKHEDEVLQTKIMLCYANLIHSLADMGTMGITAFGDLRNKPLAQLETVFFDSWAAALCNETQSK